MYSNTIYSLRIVMTCLSQLEKCVIPVGIFVQTEIAGKIVVFFTFCNSHVLFTNINFMQLFQNWAMYKLIVKLISVNYL